MLAAPPPLLKRVWQLLLAGGAMVVSAGWYIAIVELLSPRLVELAVLVAANLTATLVRFLLFRSWVFGGT